MISNLKESKNIFTIFVIYIVISIVFVVVVRNYTANQLNKELVKIQSQISSLIEIRSNAISKWVKDKEGAINSVSENLTVKMFLSTALSKTASKDDVLTQEQFTAAYLNSIASNNGFESKKDDDDIKANVKKDATAALLLVDRDFKPLLSVDYSDNLSEVVGDLKDLGVAQNVTFIKSANDKYTYLRVVKKIRNIQSDDIIGFIVAVKRLERDFFGILEFPPNEFKTSNSRLLFKNGTVFEYITEKPSDGSVITMEQNQDLADIYAVNHTNIIAEKDNVQGDKLFVSAKDLGYGGIFLVHSVSYKESFSDALNNAKSLRAISYLASLMLGAMIAFVWKHSTTEKFRKLLTEVQEKQRLLQMITQNQIQSMFLIDEDNNVVFANKIFERKHKIKDAEEYKDKPLESVVGVAAAEAYMNLVYKAHEAHEAITHLSKSRSNSREKYIQQKVIPVVSDDNEGHFRGSLVIENDITDTINERLRYEQNLNNSIQIMVRIIENRSKYFYNHATQVHDLSQKIADNLGVTDNFRKAIDIASRISNLSLALLPRELINKAGELTKEEKDLFNSIPQRTIEIIKDFNFDSPVIETLEQLNERVDGKGPMGLADGGIIISSRIIKCVNDYVAMISERPHRAALTPEAAVENLLKDKDTKYSKEVVFALANVVMKK